MHPWQGVRIDLFDDEPAVFVTFAEDVSLQLRTASIDKITSLIFEQ